MLVGRRLPVTTTVMAEASTPSVTCSAVEADPNPLAPGLPVMSDKIPISSTPDETEQGGG
jgi:hypothetical protein